MIPRIRTVKPALFNHGELYDLEAATELPLRLAYIGLWTMSDREGRFEWKPRELKTHIMPYDAVDFGAILDTLARGGFVERYEVEGRHYGVVLRFKHHQQINNREAASTLPPPPLDTNGNGRAHG